MRSKKDQLATDALTLTLSPGGEGNSARLSIERRGDEVGGTQLTSPRVVSDEYERRENLRARLRAARE
jgi:hypothetical protein